LLDEDVPEPEGFLAGEDGTSRAQELLIDQRLQMPRRERAGIVREQIDHAVLPKLLSDDGGALEHRALAWA
jgi:hypothetical protein